LLEIKGYEVFRVDTVRRSECNNVTLVENSPPYQFASDSIA